MWRPLYHARDRRVSCCPAVSPAVAFSLHCHAACCAMLCSNTLVVDDLEEAKGLCFGADHHKVVTVDGTMFKPNGTFTGTVTAHPSGWCHSWWLCPVVVGLQRCASCSIRLSRRSHP